MEDTYSDPIKATSNQNASPCSIPLVQSSNLTGIAILLCEIIIHYVEEKPPPTLIPTPSPAPMFFCKLSQTGTREGMGTRLIFSVSLHSLSGYTERESLKCFQVTTCVNPIPQLSWSLSCHQLAVPSRSEHQMCPEEDRSREQCITVSRISPVDCSYLNRLLEVLLQGCPPQHWEINSMKICQCPEYVRVCTRKIDGKNRQVWISTES